MRRNYVAGLLSSLVLLAASPMAFAVIDITAVTDAFTAVGAAGLAIGAAFIVMVVALKTFKWLRRAI